MSRLPFIFTKLCTSYFFTINQLLCFNPYGLAWTNPQCFGAVPPPGARNVCTISGDKVWLFNQYSCKLYQLDMCSFMWTQCQTISVQVNLFSCTLTSITSSRLVLHGGLYLGPSGLKYTQVLDLPTQTLCNYTSNKDPDRGNHTATIALNNDLIIIGEGEHDDDITFHVMFEPKSLQQLAMRTIYTYRTVLPWRSLPNKLSVPLEIGENEGN